MAQKPRTKTTDLRELVRRVDPDALSDEHTAYRFSNGRKFKVRKNQHGAYKP